MKVKTTNALMKYLREQHNISIDGSKDKKNLRKTWQNKNGILSIIDVVYALTDSLDP